MKRSLYVRAQKILDWNVQGAIAVGHYKLQVHMGEDLEVGVNLLSVEAETAAHKALAAFLIYAKHPKLNQQEECFYRAGHIPAA